MRLIGFLQMLNVLFANLHGVLSKHLIKIIAELSQLILHKAQTQRLKLTQNLFATMKSTA